MVKTSHNLLTTERKQLGGDRGASSGKKKMQTVLKLQGWRIPTLQLKMQFQKGNESVVSTYPVFPKG